jgi:hypothetical protein
MKYYPNDAHYLRAVALQARNSLVVGMEDLLAMTCGLDLVQLFASRANERFTSQAQLPH